MKRLSEIHASAHLASSFLKSLANENRLVILGALGEGEKNVGELETILGIRQPTLSQQLARLRSDKMVSTRRDSKQIYYSLCSDEAELVMGMVFELFCQGGDEDYDLDDDEKDVKGNGKSKAVDSATA